MARREKTIGATHEKRRYDLPLNKDAGAGFLLLLIGLMTFLATLALASSLALSAVAHRWESGLEGRLTVEIPAQGETEQAAQRIAALLHSHPAVEKAHILSKQEIMTLVSPWLDSDSALDNAPLPGLIAVELRKNAEFNIIAMNERIALIAPQARIDTHESWLKDVLRFTATLQFAAFTLAAVIGITTAAAVAGAVQSRMAIHHEEVSLLHLMGATDSYIARQFQHHSLFLALKGALAGLATGIAALMAAKAISGDMDAALLPDFRLHAGHFAILFCLPFIAALIAAATARRTVFRALEAMP